jgi:hypothetical protein
MAGSDRSQPPLNYQERFMTTLSEISGDHATRLFVPGQGTAGTVDDWVVMVADQNITVTGVTIVPNAAITANGTNFFDLTLVNKGGAAGGSTSVATRSWAATNSAAFVAEAMTLSGTAANLNVAAGDVLDLARTVTASGLAMPDMLVVVKFKLR